MTAIPSEARFDPTPNTIPALSRRNKSYAVSSNPYLPRQTIKIPLDTAMHGSLLQCDQTVLEWTLEIMNNNPFVDFLDFDSIGANSIFKEFRFMVNGTPIEKNPQYHMAMQEYMNFNGLNQDPIEMFTENAYDPCPQVAPEVRGNFIKPSMVDMMGHPMYHARLFQDDIQTGKAYWGLSPHVAGLLGNVTAQANVNVYARTLFNNTVGNYLSAGSYRPPVSHLGFGTGYMSSATVALEQLWGTRTAMNEAAVAVLPFSHAAIPHYSTTSGDASNKCYKAPGGGALPSTCASWPLTQPGKPYREYKVCQQRWEDYLCFYAKAKNVPIGVEVDVTARKQYTQGSDTQPTYGYKSTYLRCSSFIYSGLLGRLAKKWFPDMLVGPGKAWIEIDLEEARIALQVSMDPCRRVPGYRDFVPFTGRADGKSRFSATAGDIVSWVGSQGAIKFGQSAADVIATNKDVGADTVGNPFCAVYSAAACQGLLGIPLTVTSGWTQQAWNTGDSAYGKPAITNAVEGSNYGDNYVHGVPIPQYIPCSNTWAVKATNTVVNYCSEADACYGTHLARSKAQSRRTLGTLNWTSNNFNYGSYDTTYQVSNIVLYTQQLLVPDSIADTLVASAASGAISYHTTMIGSVYNNAPQNTSQNTVLTVTGSSVNRLSLYFRSTDQVSTQNAMMHNSFASYNPFVAIDYIQGGVSSSSTKDTDVHVGGYYGQRGFLSTKDNLGWNMQLKIGNELYPRQPVNGVTELLMENAKGIQTIGTMSQYPTKGALGRQDSSLDTSYLEFNPLHEGFFSAFLPIQALDDQTITGNVFFNIIELDDSQTAAGADIPLKSIRGIRMPAGYDDADTNGVGFQTALSRVGCLPHVKPMDGRFCIVYNLDTFLHQDGIARCGTTIVNNQCFWLASGVEFAKHTIDGAIVTMIITAIYKQDARVVFEAGGNALVYM